MQNHHAQAGSSFEVVIDGRIQDEHFDDEEAANLFAANKRLTMNQRIVVYQINSARHAKAFRNRLTPHAPRQVAETSGAVGVPSDPGARRD